MVDYSNTGKPEPNYKNPPPIPEPVPAPLPDAMQDEHKPGALAGNPLVDENNQELLPRPSVPETLPDMLKRLAKNPK